MNMYPTQSSNKKISDFSSYRNYFSWFNVFITTQNHLAQLGLTKNSQTFYTEIRDQSKRTVKVLTHET